ncbi:MAG: NADAR family protein [Acidobacteria bacterium]|nr:NADAR family protein [Acidobacteriota bacterium]MCB9397868.1 NADAR family protein [Acidobacteriota bacterium]
MLPIRDVEHLIRAMDQGFDPKFLFFWGHTPPRSGVNKSCFSQWFPAAFELEGQVYPTAEHYMMAKKARLFADEQIRPAILAADHPGEAKKLGRQVQGFDESIWAAARWSIVVAANRAKFGQNPEMKAFLLATGERVLVEASPYDRIWGIGLGERDPSAANPTTWKGLNLLGFALMEVRQLLV